MSDLDPVTGVLIGLVLSVALWLVLIAVGFFVAKWVGGIE